MFPVAVHPVRKPRLCWNQSCNNKGDVLSHDVLCGVCWNVDRIAEHSKEMFVKLMMKQYALVLLQERGCLLPGPLGSHVCIGVDNDLDRAPGILLHRALVGQIVGTFSDSHVAGVRLTLAGGRHLVLVSVYLADTGKDWAASEASMKQQELCINTLPALSAEKIELICGGDGNTETMVGHGTGRACSGPRAEPHFARELILREWVLKWNMSWTSTRFHEGVNIDDWWTICHKSTKRKYVLDYVWSSEHLEVNTRIRYDLYFNSDHRPIEININFPALSSAKRAKSALKMPFRVNFNAVATQKYLDEGWMHLKKQCASGALDWKVVDFQKAFRVIIDGAPSCCRSRSLPLGPPPPESLKIRLSNSFAALSEASCPIEQVSAAREFYRARRAKSDWNRTNNFLSVSTAELKQTSGPQKAVTVSKLKCGGSFSEDRQKWATEVSGFYSKLYKDDSVLPTWVDLDRRKQLLQCQQNRLAEIINSKSWAAQPSLEIPLWLVLQARAQSTSKGESTPGQDGISWGFLASMPIEVLDSLRKTFQHRLNGVSGCCSEVADCTSVLVRLIPKVPRPVDMTQWRPIALSSCVQKLYCAILILLLDEMSGPLHREACGFRKGHQVAEITEALRIGLE
jgi:hypothetical protein